LSSFKVDRRSPTDNQLAKTKDVLNGWPALALVLPKRNISLLFDIVFGVYI